VQPVVDERRRPWRRRESSRAEAPHALGWDEATLGRFLGAVTVSDAAVAGVG
jgi:hypothetical protein